MKVIVSKIFKLNKKQKFLIFNFLLFFSLLYSNSKTTVFNPSIGANLDIVSGIEGKNDRFNFTGFNFRSVELLLSLAIDPYASMNININVSTAGVELHEAFVQFPHLGAGFSLKGGFLFANVGRWNQFHTHSLPFTSEPRTYREYNGGFFLHRGLELSWLTPLPFYTELSFLVYDRYGSDSHDTDPARTHSSAGFDLDQYARERGFTFHGNHWHDPSDNNRVVTRSDLIQLAIDDNLISAESDLNSENVTSVINHSRDYRNWVYGGHLKMSFDLGRRASVDLGTSVLYRKRHARSLSIENQFYDKLIYAANMTYFLGIPRRSDFKIQLGTELLGTYRGVEIEENDQIFDQQIHRLGFFNFINIQVNSFYGLGGFANIFQANTPDIRWKQHYGLYQTLFISHFQYIRLEYSFYHYPEEIENVHRILLQYNATIGFHTHGTQR